MLKLSTDIHRPVDEVFSFLTDLRNHPQEEGTKVIQVEKTTPGPIGLGTRFREVVQMMPFVQVEMVSEVAAYDSDERIAFTWSGGGMAGELTLSFQAQNGGTLLVLQETIRPWGLMALAGPLFHRAFEDMQRRRLKAWKHALE